MSMEIKVKFAERLAEGYDVDDPLYVVWRGLKTTVAGPENFDSGSPLTDPASNSIPEFGSLSISTAFKEILTVPKPVERKKTRVTAKMPLHLSSDEVIHILEDKKKRRKKKLPRLKERLKEKRESDKEI